MGSIAKGYRLNEDTEHKNQTKPGKPKPVEQNSSWVFMLGNLGFGSFDPLQHKPKRLRSLVPSELRLCSQGRECLARKAAT